MSFFEINKQRTRAQEAENTLRMRERNTIRIAANAVVVRDGYVLLVEFDDATGIHYNFPGGGVEPGETLEEAVHREVREETSLNVTVRRLLLVVESVAARNTNFIHGERIPWNELRFFFLCDAPVRAKAKRPAVFDENQAGVRWIQVDSLATVSILPNVVEELLAAIDAPPLSVPIVANPHR